MEKPVYAGFWLRGLCGKAPLDVALESSQLFFFFFFFFVSVSPSGGLNAVDTQSRRWPIPMCGFPDKLVFKKNEWASLWDGYTL